MGKAKLAVVVLFVFAAGVGTGWLRGHSWRPAPKGKYSVRAHCLNCDWEGAVFVAKGEAVDKVVCPRCEVWYPKEQTAEDGLGALADSSDADLLAQADAIAKRERWERERRSTLVTQGRWKAGPSG